MGATESTTGRYVSRAFEPLTDAEAAERPPFTDESAALAARTLDEIATRRARRLRGQTRSPNLPKGPC
jgi:hypothetical protein